MTAFKTKNSRLFSLLFSFLPILLMAQDVSIKAFVSRNQVTTDERIQYSVEVSGSTNNLPDVNFPDMNDFYVLSGPNQSTSIQFINGAMTSSKTLSFYLKPRREGQLKLGKASIEIDGKKLESNEVIVTAGKPDPNAVAQQKSQQNVEQGDDSNIFLKTHVSKRTAYIGEQIVIEYRLYFKNNVRTYEVEKNPSNAGFWTEDFEMPSQPLIENEVIDGINYSVATLKKTAIFATRVGSLELDPMVVNLEAVIPNKRGRRSLFDSFFEPSGRSIRKTVSSQPVKLNIKPLPDAGKPADFSGAVGSFRFSVDVDKQQAEVNEAVALKLKLSGTGNIKLTDLPKVDIPPDIEQYEPKNSSSISKKGGAISGSKTSEYILIPRIPGAFKIKPIQFSYFDPQKNKYFTTNTDQIDLTITGEANNSAVTPMAGFSRKEVTLLGKDIRYIKESTNLQPVAEHNYFNIYIGGGFLLGILFFAGFIFYDDKQAKISGNIVLAKSIKASKLAAKLLTEARKNISAADQSLFYKAINSALSNFVRDKLNIELTDFNTVTAEHALKAKNIPAEIVKEYIDLVSECDLKQFAGIGSSENEKMMTMNKARTIITKMEKLI
ncbi:MAG: protein BatD [Calditrichae bacterium]|nr:protein BatD [Calditrichia bacterium]